MFITWTLRFNARFGVVSKSEIQIGDSHVRYILGYLECCCDFIITFIKKMFVVPGAPS